MRLLRRLLAMAFFVLGGAFAAHSCAAFDGGRVPRGVAFHRPAGSGAAYFGPGDLYTFLATGEETDDAYFQFEAVVPPGGGPPPHVHHREDEAFYLAQGNLEMHLGDQVVSARAGDFVNAPRGTLHWFRNVGSEPARMIVTTVPAGLEKYFEEVFTPAKDRTAAPPPVTEELIQRLNAAAPKYGIEMLPPGAADTR